MKNIKFIILFSLFVTNFLSCSKKSNDDKQPEKSEEFMRIVANSSGSWHNECMEIGLNNPELKSASTIEEKKTILRVIISEFCAKKLGISRAEALESILRYENAQYDIDIAKYDNARKEIFLRLDNLYKTSRTANDIVYGIEKLEDECKNKSIFDPTMETVLNIAKNSVLYWKDKRLDNLSGSVTLSGDPLTPRQREIMNADGEGGAVGGVWGLLGGPWSGVVGAVGGAISGSLYHAIFK
jgi:hypothetical protein